MFSANWEDKRENNNVRQCSAKIRLTRVLRRLIRPIIHCSSKNKLHLWAEQQVAPAVTAWSFSRYPVCQGRQTSAAIVCMHFTWEFLHLLCIPFFTCIGNTSIVETIKKTTYSHEKIKKFILLSFSSCCPDSQLRIVGVTGITVVTLVVPCGMRQKNK